MIQDAVSVADRALAVSAVTAAATPAQLYAERCASCHAAGTAGAPRVGASEEWRRRIDNRLVSGELLSFD